MYTYIKNQQHELQENNVDLRFISLCRHKDLPDK
jgi:hypothetical protein